MNKFFFVLATAGVAFAQSPLPPPVQPVPTNAKWRIASWTEGAEEGSNEGSVLITRTGAIQKVEITGGQGPSTVLWMAGGEIFTDVSGVLSSGRLDSWTPSIYSASDRFFGTAWVTAANRTGSETVLGVACDVYETTVAPDNERNAATMMGVDPSTLKVPQKAWIDATTRLPVAVLTPEGRFRYTFLPAPDRALELPTAFREKQRALREEVSRQQAEAAVR